MRRHTAARRWLWPENAGGQPGVVAIALDGMAIYGYFMLYHLLWLFMAIYGYLLDGMAITF